MYDALYRFIAFLEKVPTTKIRILITIFLIGGTGALYLRYACWDISPTGICMVWEPSSNWLIFLSALAGVDVTQFAAKSYAGVRHAQVADAYSEEAESTDTPEDTNASTDVSEIYANIQEQKG